jgi:ESCRT-I complex subunit TSG101
MDMETTGPVQPEQPQRPPNPEKMQAIEYLDQQLEQASKTLNDEATQDDEALRYTEQTLSWMEGQIDAQTRELDNITKGCHANEAILTEKIETARRVISDAKSRQKPNVDEILCAENIVYNQLYQLVAEDHAIDDTMYILGKALDKDRVQLDPFLKHTRTLAREQFLKRALINKISCQVGLD